MNMQSQFLMLPEKIGIYLFKKVPQPAVRYKNIILSSLPIVVFVIGLVSTTLGFVNVVFKVLRVIFTSPEFLDIRLVMSTLITLISGLLLLKNYTYLKKHKKLGWNMVFAATLITGGLNMVTNQLGMIQSLLFLYVLFAIRPHYHS